MSKDYLAEFKAFLDANPDLDETAINAKLAEYGSILVFCTIYTGHIELLPDGLKEFAERYYQTYHD